MSKELTISVEKDHLDGLTNVSGTTALAELIWNSLDADATSVTINYEYEPGLDSYESITIQDNGHGISNVAAQLVFGKLGGSVKKSQRLSPGKRLYHGKEGQGRFRAFALGDLIEYQIFYQDRSLPTGEHFTITLDRNNIQKAIVGDPLVSKTQVESGTIVNIRNVNQEKAKKAFAEKSIEDLQQKFAVYNLSYPTFQVSINGHLLDFSSAIKNKFEQEYHRRTDDGKSYKIRILVIEWNKAVADNKTLYFCGLNAIVLHQTDLSLRKIPMPLTTYILSDYIQELHDKNMLILGDMAPMLSDIVSFAKQTTKNYVRRELAKDAKNIIDELKEQNLYPYKYEPLSEVEKVEREVFDILTHQIHEYLPTFQGQEYESKKLTLILLKESIEKDTGVFLKIMKEVLNLPENKQKEFMEIIETTSLDRIIDTMREVQDRLRTIHELRVMIYDKNENYKYKERSQFHKIIKQETWIFGDDYTYGADDVNLRNVLKAYLKHLERTDFEEIITEEESNGLNLIPDICLWKQYSLGETGHYKNLVIELKRPNKVITQKELGQIKKYARVVAIDERFPKKDTKWEFYLLGMEIDDDVSIEMNQENREFGLVSIHENIKVWVFTWGQILHNVEARMQYLKNKLDYQVTGDDDGIKLLKKKYSEIFAEQATDNVQS